MEKSTEPQPSTQWFVFFKDQLLLKKGYTDKGEIKYSVPVSIEPPLTPEAGSNIHEVFPPNGKQVRAFALEQPVAETDEWVMIGLRASYDYISPDEYRSAGKAFQILYWDEHSHFCPVCGTAMEHQTPIMKKCPNCGNTDKSKMNIARRTCGYIGLNDWNQGRTQEIKERYVHLGGAE